MIFRRSAAFSNARGADHRITTLLLLCSVAVPALLVLWSALHVSKSEELALRQIIAEAKEREVALLAQQIQRQAAMDKGFLRSNTDNESIRTRIIDALTVGLCEAFIETSGFEALSQADDTDSVSAITEAIRFSSQTFGPLAALRQIEEFYQTGELSNRYMSGGRSLEVAILFEGKRLAQEAGVEHTPLTEGLLNWLAGIFGPIPATQRYFVLRELQSMETVHEDIEILFRAEETARIWRQTPVPSTSHGEEGFFIHGKWVCLWIHPGDRLAVTSLEPFKNRLLNPLLESTLSAGISLQILTPGATLTEEHTDWANVDMGAPLEGWRLLLQTDVEFAHHHSLHSKLYQYALAASLGVSLSVMLVIMVIAMVRRQMNRAAFRNSLVATVSHELRTPISSVQLLVDTLLHENAPEDRQKQRKYLQLIQNENRRLAALVERFLTFSRMEHNRSALEFKPLEVFGLLKEAEASFRERFSQEDYTLNVSVSPDVHSISADRQSLLTGLANLLENAHKYSGKEKIIHLSAYPSGTHMILEVADNGPGIPKKEGRKVFKKFYQLDRTLTTHKGGVGLGLSIVQFVAKRHRGKVNLISSPGQGCRVQILIPYEANPHR